MNPSLCSCLIEKKLSDATGGAVMFGGNGFCRFSGFDAVPVTEFCSDVTPLKICMSIVWFAAISA